MIEHLEIQGVGPAPQLRFNFGPRLNLLTGDNGLGKTFALDLAWFALTRTWAGDRKIIPLRDPSLPPGTRSRPPAIGYHVHGRGGPNTPVALRFKFREERWVLPMRRPPMPGLVIYARIDGGFSLWDPARNYWRQSDKFPAASPDRPAKFDFSRKTLWEGLALDDKTLLCRGLIEDWQTWQLKRNGAFDLLCEVLRQLSPGENEMLQPGEPRKLSVLDSREVPTLRMPYGWVPVVQASAGIQRVLSLAYMLVWSWLSNREAAKQIGDAPAQRIILLWDEVEAHLHPQWQRLLLPAVMRVIQSQLLNASGTTLQVIATTHAPLVCASVETLFDRQKDKFFNLELNESGQVELEDIPWAKHGDVVSWLESEAFDLKSGYGVEAEAAMSAAGDFLAGTGPQDDGTRDAIEARLRKALGGDDPFLVDWFAKTRPEVLRSAARARMGRPA